MTKINLDFYWEGREPSEADEAGKLARFVNGLPTFDPIYQSWLKSPDTRKEILPVPLTGSEASKILKDNVARYDAGDAPWPELGSMFRAGHAGAAPYNFRTSCYADTYCKIGAHGLNGSATPNLIFMRFSELRSSTDRPWRASELRAVMRFALDIWRPVHMWAFFSDLDAQTTADPTSPVGWRVLWPRIGWITYLPPSLAALAKYPTGVEVERLGDGAVLVSVCEEPFDSANAKASARLRALEAALRPIQS